MLIHMISTTDGREFRSLTLTKRQFIGEQSNLLLSVDDIELGKDDTIIVDCENYTALSLYYHLLTCIPPVSQCENLIFYETEGINYVEQYFLIIIPSKLDLDLIKILDIHPVDAMIAEFIVLSMSRTHVMLIGLMVVTMFDYLESHVMDGKYSCVVRNSTDGRRYRIAITDMTEYNKIKAKRRVVEG